jgi:hypothetical protein
MASNQLHVLRQVCTNAGHIFGVNTVMIEQRFIKSLASFAGLGRKTYKQFTLGPPIDCTL